MLGVGPTTIKRWAEEGRLVFWKTEGGHRRFQRASIERERRRLEGGDDAVESWLDLLWGADSIRLQGALLEQRASLGNWADVADSLDAVVQAIGSRWEAGDCSVATEHIATHTLQRALAAIATGQPLAMGAPRCALAAAQGELHTVGLSLAEITLAEAGWRSLWLGAPISTADVLRFLSETGADALILSASTAADQSLLEEGFRQLSQACADSGVQLVIGGRGPWPGRIDYGHHLDSFRQLRELLQSLSVG